MENIWILPSLVIAFGLLCGLSCLGILMRPKKHVLDTSAYDTLVATHDLLVTENQANLHEFTSRLQNSELENKRLETQAEYLDAQLTKSIEKQEELTAQISHITTEKQKLAEESIRIESNLKEERALQGERQRNAAHIQKTQEETQAKLQEQMNSQFKNMAQEILEKNSKDLQEKSTKDFGQVLAPLKDQLGNFDKLVRETQEKEITRHQDMKNELKNINDTALKMSKEASDLTNSLKGQSKVRGNWGEMVLEHSLELSGLRKDHEYVLEKNFQNEQGKNLRPDAIVKMPGNRSVIVDAKLSLIAYDNYMNCDDDGEREQHLKAHVTAVKTHIKQLSSKNYQDIPELHSPDFVVMFVPLESALMQALEQDPSLAAEALKNNIGIASPSTIMMVLRTIEHLWRTERQIDNAEEIARQGGNLYDKFSGFIDDLKKVEKQLGLSQSALDDSFKKLSTGSGNLIGRAQKLQQLGIKVKKQIAIESDDSSDALLPQIEKPTNTLL